MQLTSTGTHFHSYMFGQRILSSMQANFLQVAQLEKRIRNKEFIPIIQDAELFWLAYGKAFAATQHHQSSCNPDVFVIKGVEEGNIFFHGKETTITSIKAIIEALRLFFLKGITSQQPFELFLIPKEGNIHFLPDSRIFSLFLPLDAAITHNYSSSHYECYVKPTLASFSDLFEAEYLEDHKSVPVTDFDHTYNQTVETIIINWKGQTLPNFAAIVETEEFSFSYPKA